MISAASKNRVIADHSNPKATMTSHLDFIFDRVQTYSSSLVGNSNVIFPFLSITRKAWKGLPDLEMNLSITSLLLSFSILVACVASMGCSRIVLPMGLNVQRFASRCEFSQT